MRILFGILSCLAGLLAALSAWSHFTWGKAAGALFLFTLGILLIRDGLRQAGNGSGEDGPDFPDLVDMAGDAADLLDD